MIAPTRPLLCFVLLAPLSGGTLFAGLAERYIEAQLKVVRTLEASVDAIAGIADESATRLVAGGNLYLSGEPGMISELFSRAGGLSGAKGLPLDQPLPALGRNDVILVGDYGTPGKLADTLKKLGSEALVIGFVSAEHPLRRAPVAANVRIVPVDIPLDSRMLQPAGGEPLMPLAPPALATAQWTYVAELLGACRRQGRQLGIYLSTFIDFTRTRYERTRGMLFEPNLRPSAVPRGEYARTFLGHARLSLEMIRTRELSHLRQAAAWVREANAAGRQVTRSLIGHLPPIEAGHYGDAKLFAKTQQLAGEKGVAWVKENVRSGDVILFVAYRDDDAVTVAANALGARTIALTSVAPGIEQSRSARHLHVNQHWPVNDAVLELEGYDVKACPLSLIVTWSCYQIVVGEAVAPSRPND
jgi:uncharacterized phosphosugar-binding protein